MGARSGLNSPQLTLIRDDAACARDEAIYARGYLRDKAVLWCRWCGESKRVSTVVFALIVRMAMSPCPLGEIDLTCDN